MKTPITSIALNSTEIKPGYTFVALPSMRPGGTNGDHYIKDAISRGATTIVARPSAAPLVQGTNCQFIAADNPHLELSRIAARMYPEQPECIVAVTGTNGKTSTTHFTHQIWQLLDYSSATLGTLTAGQPLTTPDAITLHKSLQQLAHQGVTHLSLEASSHGLDQHRMDSVKLAAAAFTNMSQDHLDYHGNMRDYYLAKARLFDEILPKDSVAVINANIPAFPELQRLCQQRNLKIISYGMRNSDIELVNNEELKIFGQTYALESPLIGSFQLSNALAALGLVLATGGETSKAVEALSHLEGIPGRLQFVGVTPSGARVYVDYAHTPGALEAALKSLRPRCKGSLSLVFGCGGDRDADKRGQMGRIASQLAHKVYITNDNPRSEPPEQIHRDILAGCKAGVCIPDRKTAIATAIDALTTDDILLIAGKGHENQQIIGDQILPFDDFAVSRTLLSSPML